MFFILPLPIKSFLNLFYFPFFFSSHPIKKKTKSLSNHLNNVGKVSDAKIQKIKLGIFSFHSSPPLHKI